MNTELLEALNILEKEKDISKETILDAIENSLLNACKNHFGKADNIKLIMDRETCDYQLLAEKTVVEEPEDELEEISLEKAKEIDSKYELGDVVQIPIESKSFGRIATQNAKNLILQKKNEELKAAIAMQKQLRRKAQTDLLTGLKNKTTTEELCRACIEDADGKDLALFVMDLDDFKHINDEQGHQAGDAVLKAFGATLLGCIRQDDIAGRIGGDEFMMLMSGVKDRTQAAGSAARIYTALKENPDFNATCSMGIVLAKGGQMSYEELFGIADAALYTAKDRGKDLYHITETASEGVS